MKYGFLRAACCSPRIAVADCDFNAQQIISIADSTDENVQLLIFPELSITGYTCGDLFLQRALIDSSVASLSKICSATKDSSRLLAVGLPVRHGAHLFNCAAFVHKGAVIAIIPKTFIPNYSEFYEHRWFSPAVGTEPKTVDLCDTMKSIPFGTDIFISDENDALLKIGCEICEDLWAPLSPSVRHALAGATVLVNISASNELVGKADYRRSLVASQSAKTVSAYLYSGAGRDESTTDVVFSGHNIIAINGKIASESAPFSEQENAFTQADIDLELIAQERLRLTTFSDCGRLYGNCASYRTIPISFHDNALSLLTPPCRHPFIPSEEKPLKARCKEVTDMQAEGLAKRLRHIHTKSAVIGLSGGLDSTLALLVTCRAFDLCGLPRTGITGVTMPCFGTTDRTHRNACSLIEQTGASIKEIPIANAVRLHFSDIGQNEAVHDVTYENSQARERTQILMDFANKTGGIVIGTGDLSELSLGWATYNGDHMSMYGVNSSIPKTLVRHLVSWFSSEAKQNGKGELSSVLEDILDTPVSPELLPPVDNGIISQKTEELVGPYELHDFFLYYMLRFGFGPRKILFLAEQAFTCSKDAPYTRETILKWLRVFYKRFFSQQFKRSCMPDGCKVGTVSLSPRGDWRMPSDASAQIWLSELDGLSYERKACRRE